MTRKDYELVSSTISLTFGAKRNDQVRREGIRDIALDLAYRFERENPHFNRDRFLKDCGITK